MILLPAPHGRIEAVINEAPGRAGDAPVALVCHPHPAHGGTLHTKAVYALTKGLQGAGVTCLRFNFRGVGRSTGSFDGGPGEMEDARLALDHLHTLHPHAPLWVAGFSFGSWVGTTVGATDPRVNGLIALAPPFARYDFAALRNSPQPKLILQAEADELAPLVDCEREVAELRPPKALCIFAGAGHLFLECLPQLRSTTTHFARTWPPAGERVWIRTDVAPPL